MKKDMQPPQFSSSAILTTEDQKKFVRTLLPGIFDCQVTRLYKATDPNVGFTGAKFHSLCDGKGPTLSLIKTVAGHIFGGFTTISWDSSGAYKNDTQSFLFSVDKQTKYPIVKDYQYAIYCGASYGPTFGGGNDIYVHDNSNSNKSSYTYDNSKSTNCCYNLPVAPGKSESILTDGERNF